MLRDLAIFREEKGNRLRRPIAFNFLDSNSHKTLIGIQEINSRQVISSRALIHTHTHTHTYIYIYKLYFLPEKNILLLMADGLK